MLSSDAASSCTLISGGFPCSTLEELLGRVESIVEGVLDPPRKDAVESSFDTKSSSTNRADTAEAPTRKPLAAMTTPWRRLLEDEVSWRMLR